MTNKRTFQNDSMRFKMLGIVLIYGRGCAFEIVRFIEQLRRPARPSVGTEILKRAGPPISVNRDHEMRSLASLGMTSFSVFVSFALFWDRHPAPQIFLHQRNLFGLKTLMQMQNLMMNMMNP